jgi:hypothetical protein
MVEPLALRGQDRDPGAGCFFPKIVRGNGVSLAHPAGQIEQFVNSEDGNGPLKVNGTRWPRRCWTSRAPVFCDLIPTVPEQVKIEGASHFLQEDRGERPAQEVLKLLSRASHVL